MKKIVMLFALVVLVASCGKQSDSYKQLKAENDSLMEVHAAQTSEFNETMAVLNDVEDNFTKLREAENYLTVQNVTTGELSQTQKERITENFELFSEILKKNKEDLARLQTQFDSSKKQSSELKKTIKRLQEELETKSALILSLQNELGARDEKIRELSLSVESLASNVSDLSQQTAEQKEALAKQDAEINTVRYMFGTTKELKDYKVLVDGKVLRANFNQDDFIKADSRELTSIPLSTKSAKVLTSHPSDSYKLVKGADKKLTLMIVDTKKFWSSSKYLVILVD